MIILQALIDGPETGVPRQAIAYKKVVLTPYVLKKLPRAAGSPTVSKVWKASGVEEKWESSAWAKKRATQKTRKNLGDFDRFKVQMLKSERRKSVGKGTERVLLIFAYFDLHSLQRANLMYYTCSTELKKAKSA